MKPFKTLNINKYGFHNPDKDFFTQKKTYTYGLTKMKIMGSIVCYDIYNHFNNFICRSWFL